MAMRGAWRLVLLLAPLCSTALAAQSAPAVERVGPARISAEPGRQVSAAFRVRNPSSASVTAELSLPRGWPSVTPDAAAPLEPGASAVRIAGTVVPRGAAAGVYLLRFRLRSAASSADSLLIEVRERREIAVTVEDAPRFAVSGASYAVTFRVANRGNARAAVRLRAESGRGFPARLDAASVDLTPGEGREVRVTVTTRAGEGALAHRVALVATQAADASATGEARVQVVPRAAGGGSGVRTLPARVGLHARRGADASGGFPGEVSASGALPRGDAHLDVFYRGRGAAAPEMGEQEQLSLALRSPRGEVKAGDQLWTLSPLTAPGRFGSGAGGRINAGAAWAEGFSERNRFVPGSPRVTAAALGMGDDRRSVAVNYAARDGDGALTLRARARPARGVGVDAEAGAAGGGARAAYLHAYAGGPRVSLDLRGIEAGADFPGEQRGRSLRQAHAAARPVDGLRLHAAYDREARTDTSSLLLAPKEARTATLRAGASIADAVTLERRVETREGEGAGGPWSRAAASWVATASLRLRRVTLSGGAQTGTVEDRLTDDGSTFGRIWARVGGAVGRHSFWAAVDRSAGSSVETGREQERVSGSAGVSLQPSSATRIALSAQAGALAWAEEPDGQVDGTVEQRLPGGHTLRLRVRAFPWADEGRRRPTVRLDYAVPLRLPVGRAPDAGTVSGRVMDEETGRPVADALVRVGGRAVLTDARGRWAVAGVAPGRHTVEVDPVSVGVGRVVVRPDALAVELAGGGSRRVEIGVSRAARLEGAVAVPDAESGVAGVEGAVVELRRGGERRRRVTDAAGRFTFADLEPGRWTLAVVRADLPPHHALERETVEIELAPGGAGQVALRAIARKREMRIVAGGEVVLGAPAARGAAPAVLPPPRLPAGVKIIPPADSAASATEARPAAPPSAAATPARPVQESASAARRAVARPWRERGESGFSDWANDSYVVQPGDESLTAIAWLVYRDGALWPRLWLANRDLLPTPDRIEPGMELVVPPLAPLTAGERAAVRELRDRRR